MQAGGLAGTSEVDPQGICGWIEPWVPRLTSDDFLTTPSRPISGIGCTFGGTCLLLNAVENPATDSKEKMLNGRVGRQVIV